MLQSLNAHAEKSLYDLFAFLVDTWGLELDEQPHREMVRLIEQAEFSDARPWCLLLVPRGCYKSSIVRGAAYWKQLRQLFLYDNPYHRIGYASASLALGKKFLNVIEGQMRYNKRLIEAYGPQWVTKNQRGAPGSKREDGLVLSERINRGETAQVSEPSFWIASRRSISTGFHADEVFVDDLNNKENSGSPYQRQQVHEYWSLLQPILNRRDRADHPSNLTLTATRWNDDDVAGAVIRKETEKIAESPEYESPYAFIQRGARDGPNGLYFPRVLTEEELVRLEYELGPTLFSSQYLNDPVGVNGFVHEDQIKFIPRKQFPNLRRIRATCDPNQHTDAKVAGCYAAIMVSGYDQFSKLYFLDAMGSREWDTADFIDALFLVHERYEGITIDIEDAHMSHFDHALKMEQEKREIHLRVRWLPADRKMSKYDRWLRLQPRFQHGDVFFSEDIQPKVKVEIKNELVRGPAARFNDFLDAMAMAESGVRPKIDKTGRPIAGPPQPQPGLPAPTVPVITYADAIPSLKSWKGLN